MAARIPCIISTCTCHKRLGKHQAEFVLRIKNGDLPSDICTDLGLHLICCRTNMIYPPTFPVNNVNEGSFVDEVGAAGMKSIARGKPLVVAGPVLYLDGVPDFPDFDE